MTHIIMPPEVVEALFFLDSHRHRLTPYETALVLDRISALERFGDTARVSLRQRKVILETAEKVKGFLREPPTRDLETAECPKEWIDWLEWIETQEENHETE